MRSGASEVYVHGMPGGQYTNLREQARSLGIDDARWPEVARAYAEVNEMFGDIVKVTPTSKVVGDMALLMVTSGLTPEQVLDPRHGDRVPRIGRLAVPRRSRPAVRRLPAGAAEEGAEGRAAADGAAGRGAAADRSGAGARGRCRQKTWREITDEELASYLMYPKVFLDYMQATGTTTARSGAADAAVLLRHGAGRRNQRRHRARQDADRALRRRERRRTRTARARCSSSSTASRARCKVPDRSQVALKPPRRKADPGNAESRRRADAGHGRDRRRVSQGGKVTRGDVLVTIEAMKMETTVRADRDGKVAEVVARPGEQVDAKDLLVVLE